LSQAMADASICGLGQAAPNPIRCVVKHFPHEIALANTDGTSPGAMKPHHHATLHGHE